MGTNFVEDLLQRVAETEEKCNESVRVDKQIDLNFDLRHLLAIDCNPIDGKQFRANKESYLRDLTRDNTQLIINKLWELETKRVDDIVVAELPPNHYLLPRSKPVPKPRAPTKWETYAKEKGIKNKTREKLVWDEVNNQWKPRFGFRGINQNNDWVIEVPDNKDPNVNYFERRGEEKRERVAKNELQRLRNIARSQRVQLGGNSGVIPQLNQSKEQLKKASVLAKHSTASVGRFTESVADEKPPKNSGKKRKFEPNFGDMSKEKNKSMKIIEDIINKKPKLDINKAIEPLVKTRKNKSNKKSKPDFKPKNGPKFDRNGPKFGKNGSKFDKNGPKFDRNGPKFGKNGSNFDKKGQNNDRNSNNKKMGNKFGANGKIRKK